MDDIFSLFSDGTYTSSSVPRPWYPGAKIDLDDYGRHLITHLPKGRDNAIPASSLAEKLGFPWEGNQFPLRHLIRRLVLDKGWPIATAKVDGGLGLYLIDSDIGAELYREYLDQKIRAIEELRDAVLEGWERRKRSKKAGHDWPPW